MPRYSVHKPSRAAWIGEEIEWEPEPPTLIPHVEVEGADETDTGLIDKSGRTIMRIANPIGFQAEIE